MKGIGQGVYIFDGIRLFCGNGMDVLLKNVVEKAERMTYNILNKTASKGGSGSPPWQNVRLKDSRLLCQEQGGYFLCI